MKNNLCSTLIFLIFAFAGVSQDIITKSDGSTIETKIIEVHDNEIHYKKFSNLDGPTYILETVNIKQVAYANGDIETYEAVKSQEKKQPETWNVYKEEVAAFSEEIEINNDNFYYHNRRLGTAKMKNLIFSSQNQEAIRMWNMSNASTTIAWVAGFGSIPVAVIGGFGGLLSFNTDWQLIFAGGGFAAFHVLMIANHTLRVMAKNQKVRAVELYNESLQQKEHNEGDYY